MLDLFFVGAVVEFVLKMFGLCIRIALTAVFMEIYLSLFLVVHTIHEIQHEFAIQFHSTQDSSDISNNLYTKNYNWSTLLHEMM